MAVKGTVKYKGQPLTGGIANFAPVGADGRRAGTGPISSNGEFVISSFDAGDGVQPGEYKVFFSPPESTDGSKKEVPKSTFPKKYESAATTDITEKVDAAKTVEYELKD